MNQDNQILTDARDGVGVITLNRPEALNALSLEMIRQIAVTLKKWERDDGIEFVVFRGAGERAFCAGGDVKSFYRTGMDYRRGEVDLRIPTLFFAEEYSLNKQIFDYPKDTVALIDGIVMGGGVGIAGNCKHRLAGENTVFAMPEVRIGFFPDVGSIYHFNKPGVSSELSRYLVLTGAHGGRMDMAYTGMADASLNAADHDAFINKLREEGMDAALKEYLQEASWSEILRFNRYELEHAFKTLDVNEICTKLREFNSEWSLATLDAILSRSPLSVLVTAKYLKEMEGRSFDEVIAMDFRLAQRFIEHSDMYEGIRAALIDRDDNPHWRQAYFDDVKPEDVTRCFESTGYELSDVQIFAA